MAGGSRVNSFSSGAGMSSTESGQTEGQKPPIFSTAVVYEFLSNPQDQIDKPLNPPLGDGTVSLREMLEDQSGKLSISNTKFIERAPRNSIIAKIISNGEGTSGNLVLLYPFFPPHISFPVKAGEQVWVVYATPGTKANIGFWMCRKPSDVWADDINYTHGDRSTLPATTSGASESASTAFSPSEGTIEAAPGSFPNGTSADSRTLADELAYEDLITSSVTYSNQFTGEEVPRFSKRSPDLTLQGSNNTLISLGTDRAGDTDSSLSGGTTTGENDQRSLAGSIDIVTGRGRSGDEYNEITSPAGDAVEAEERGYEEINKNPSLDDTSLSPNQNEGDPDFIEDLSRIYVSMKTNGDKNFDLEFTNPAAPQVDEKPYVVAKSTEVRLVGRDGGSVRLVKEGDAQAEICLMSDGTIVIEGTNSARDAQKVIRGEDLADAADEFASAIATAIVATLGNMGGPVVDGGIASACSTFAGAIRESLSEEVFIK